MTTRTGKGTTSILFLFHQSEIDSVSSLRCQMMQNFDNVVFSSLGLVLSTKKKLYDTINVLLNEVNDLTEFILIYSGSSTINLDADSQTVSMTEIDTLVHQKPMVYTKISKTESTHLNQLVSKILSNKNTVKS